jgi:hypothetical protein
MLNPQQVILINKKLPKGYKLEDSQKLLREEQKLFKVIF